MDDQNQTTNQPEEQNVPDTNTVAAISSETPEDTTGTEDGGTDQAQNFLTVDGLVKGYIRDLEKLRQDLKMQQSMLRDAIENDAMYKQHNDKAKEIAKVKNAAKQQIMKQQAVIELDAKVKDLKEEIKATEEGLMSYLIEYQKLAHTNQIIDDNGTIHEIVTVPKLVKKSAKYNP